MAMLFCSQSTLIHGMELEPFLLSRCLMGPLSCTWSIVDQSVPMWRVTAYVKLHICAKLIKLHTSSMCGLLHGNRASKIVSPLKGGLHQHSASVPSAALSWGAVRHAGRVQYSSLHGLKEKAHGVCPGTAAGVGVKDGADSRGAALLTIFSRPNSPTFTPTMLSPLEDGVREGGPRPGRGVTFLDPGHFHLCRTLPP